MEANAREEMLARIARANVRPKPAPRAPIVASGRSRHDIVEQFAEYAAEYRANVTRTHENELPATIASILNGAHTVIPADLPASWCPNGIVDAPFDYRELEKMQAVVTGCAVAIAESGSVVLDAGLGQGRRAITLIPDHHVCVVFEHQIVDTMPEAVAELTTSVSEGRPLTWISGPSATSDIELSRVEGVHGPRILDIVIVAA